MQFSPAFGPIVVAVPRAEDWPEDMDNRISACIAYGWDTKNLRAGMPVVVVTGWRAGAGYTNTVRIISVPDHRPSNATK